MQASELEIGDEVRVGFTYSLCTVTDIDYSYGRVSYMLSYYENGMMQNTAISPEKCVKLVKRK